MSYSHLAGVYDGFAYDFDYDAWTAWYIEMINSCSSAVKEICDCGCGTGSISVRLARRGYRLTGIDVSEEMLAEAQIKARKAGVRIPFIKQDMRNLSLPHKTDAVISTCDGVNYLLTDADVSSFFNSVYNNLKPDGIFCFDISNYEKLSDNGLYGEDMESQAYLWQNEFDEKTCLLRMKLSLFVKDDDGKYNRYTEEHVQKAHKTEKIKELIIKSGFSIVEIIGNDTGISPGPGGKRIYFIAKKEK